MNRKLRKLLRSPPIFFRDYLLKRHPLILNEVDCPAEEEGIVARHLSALYATCHADFPVDVVFTWVDDKDPSWRQRFEYERARVDESHFGSHATDVARFENHDELRYSVLAVRKFLPWVRRIHVVTDRQRPAWLGENDLHVTIVDHTEIIDPAYLPTFNSHVIEAHLHRIPGLNEHFIYFNDDVFVARPLAKEHFFRANGITALFASRKRLDAQRERGHITPTLDASGRCASLLERDYGVRINAPLVHTYVPLRKRGYLLAWQQYEAEIRAFLSNRFRGREDMNLATFLVPWLCYLEGWATESLDLCCYFNVRSPAAPVTWQHVLQRKSSAAPHSFCANDFKNEGNSASPTFASHLRSYYSE